MALYPLGTNDVVKPLSNATIHIESALSQKRDVAHGVTLYVPSGYQHVTTNLLINDGTIINEGEIYVDGEPIGGTGAVTSVGLSMPSIFSVSGSPITGSGTFVVTIPAGTTGSGAVVLATTPSFSGIADTGIIAAGTWNGTKIGLAYGGTNADLSATGGTSQVLKQTTLGGAITVGQLANTDITGLGTMSTQNANSVAITGGSIDGTTVGSTTQAAGKFTTLAATGVTTLSAGTAGAPSLTFGDSTTGLYRPAANQLGLTVSGTSVATITSALWTISIPAKIGNGQPSVSTTTGDLVVGGGAGFGGSINASSTIKSTQAGSTGAFISDYGANTNYGLFLFAESGVVTGEIARLGSNAGLGIRNNTLEISAIGGDVTIVDGYGTQLFRFSNAKNFSIDTTQILTTQQAGMGATLSAATAGTTYTATEQAMLQNVYNKMISMETKLKTHGLIAT